MTQTPDQFFDHPILNSPYSYPGQHWELDDSNQPTGKVIHQRRQADFITPIPRPKKRRQSDDGVQQTLSLFDTVGISDEAQGYDLLRSPVGSSIRSTTRRASLSDMPTSWEPVPL